MRAGAALGSTLLVAGCLYLNLVYNAQSLFDEAESARREGREEEARVLYDSVVAKAARSYRAEPEGGWADDALYLLGRAYLRRGEPAEAAAALDRALEISTDPEVRAGATLHLGVTAAISGDPNRGLALLNDAMRVLPAGSDRAEGHLWRARILLGSGRPEAAWWDLDRAEEEDRRYRVDAGLVRLGWEVAHGDVSGGRSAVDRLLAVPDARLREDSVLSLVRVGVRAWGARAGAALLGGGHRSVWPQAYKDRLVLERARLRLEAGDVRLAERDAEDVADGVGAESTEARIFLARLRLRSALTLDDLEPARAVLLPAVRDPRVLDLLESMRMVELLAGRSAADQPVEALFAAGELARDALQADRLARNLFLRCSERDGAPWAGKALLAALALTGEPGDRSPILLRLARLRNDPYVLLAQAGAPSSPEVMALDERLRASLDSVLTVTAARARELDVLARERSDTAR